MFRIAAPSMPRHGLRDLCRLALASSAALLLSACGGGDRAEDYKPDAVLVFGDESGAFASFTSDSGTSDDLALRNADGSRGGVIQGLTYSVNVVDTDDLGYVALNPAPSSACAYDYSGTTSLSSDGEAFTATCTRQYILSGLNAFETVQAGNHTLHSTATSARYVTTTQFLCNRNTTWSQVVAHAFDKGFSEDCPLDGSGAYAYAANGAKVANVDAQLAAAGTRIAKGTLAIFMVGQNDVIEIYNDDASFPNLASKKAEAQRRALLLAADLKQVLEQGAKVIYANVPPLGFAPAYRDVPHADECSAYGASSVKRTNGNVLPHNCRMDEIVRAFNDALYLQGMSSYAQYKGDRFAYVDAETLTLSYLKNTSYVNARLCLVGSAEGMKMPDGAGAPDTTTSLPYCTSKTLVDGGSTSTYLWSDDRHLGLVMQLAVGSLGATRAANNF